MDIRVALFEDNKLVRDALQAILNGTQGFTCCGALQMVIALKSDIAEANRM